MAKKRTKQPSSWRGSSTSGAPTTHRWQGSAAGKRSSSKTSSRRWQWRIYAAATVTLVVVLVALLMIWKPKTSLIGVAVTQYDPSVPINAWAAEDIQGLQQLNEILEVQDLSMEWQNRETGRNALRDALSRSQGSHPLLIYISMHGVVDEDGRPCLLPPKTSPLSTSSFIPVADLLGEIGSNVSDRRKKLLILDCHRLLVNWDVGIVYNTFAERLHDLLKSQEGKVPNLAVLCAASGGQQSWAAPELQGSAFGRFLQLGLSGLADEEGSGNQNGKVSLFELRDYLQSQLPKWTQANRAEYQWAQLYPDDVKDFRVTWSLKRKNDTLWDSFASPARVTPTVSPDDITPLWKELDALRADARVRYRPRLWRDLERGLIRLEHLSDAGSAYADEARNQLDRLKSDLRRIRGLDDRFKVGALTLPTLPLNQYFGLVSDEQVKLGDGVLARLLDPKSTEVPSTDELAGQLETTAFLLAARQQGVVGLWNQFGIVKKVLDLRRSAENLAVPNGGQPPGDERAHYFARQAMDATQPVRHRLEDVLFVGQRNADVDMSQLQVDVRLANTWVKTVEEQAIQSVQTRDRCWAELPSLAAWICRPLPPELKKGVPEALSRQQEQVARLNTLIDQARRLDEQLMRPSKMEYDESLPFLSVAEGVANQLQSLKQPLDAKLQEELDSFLLDPQSVRQMMALLELPSIPATRRSELNELLRRIRAELHEGFFEKVADISVPTEAPTSILVSQITAWRHPLVQLAAANGHPVEAGVIDVERVESGTKQVRRAMLQCAKPTLASEIGTITDPVAFREALVQSERRFRSLIPLGFAVPDEVDPIEELRRFDLQQLLLWHRQNVINGAWQSLPLERGSTAFFQLAANQCKLAAKNLGQRSLGHRLVDDQLKGQDGMLADRLDARVQALSEATTSDDSIQLKVSVAHQAGKFSDGTAAVFVRDRGQRVEDLSFGGGVQLPILNEDRPPFNNIIGSDVDLSANLHAVVFFRGKEFEHEFVVKRFEGIGVDFEPYRYGPPTITLQGDLNKEASLVFVLDCSRSMGGKIPARGPGGQQMIPRIEVAKTHLATMLTRLAATNTKVGVRFVGHRINYQSRSPYPKIPRRNWQRKIPADLIPPHDVETILPLQEFDIVAANNVIRNFLPRVTNYGQSPLYLALVESFREFDVGTNERKGVIAITDGENLQRLAPNDTKFEDWRTNLDQQFVLNRATVPVHFLDFAKDAASRNDEFMAIAERTNGTYVSAKTGADLLRELKKHLDLDGYYVEDIANKILNPDVDEDGDQLPLPLNVTLRMKSSQFQPQGYQVRFRNAQKTVELVGGEAVELKAVESGDSADIVRIDYPSAPQAVGQLISGTGRKSPYRLSAHRTKRNGADVQFTVSMQSTRSHFTQRPREFWVQVTPMFANGAGDSYVFYDANFEQEKPVPELSWWAERWPDDAKEAQIQVWCKYEPTPSRAVVLADVFNQPDRFSQFVDSNAATGVQQKITYDEGDRKLRFVEQHGSGRSDPDSIYRLRVLFETTSDVIPTRIVRSFDQSAGIATHEFYFSTEGWAAIRNNARGSRIRIATRKDVQDGALQLPGNDGLRIVVTGEGGLLPVGRRGG